MTADRQTTMWTSTFNTPRGKAPRPSDVVSKLPLYRWTDTELLHGVKTLGYGRRTNSELRTAAKARNLL